ncbi:MAG: hypothetical protein AUK47_03120 [Deltaproteobacteria bacterium CG2_30_63_29]|nr:MAG: hypothetical protein AUK47_03120 [Deltaproteobacteria bacterium CG2_30_63_29]PIV98143.1 MAG: hypothetical protein COW42_16370 [Deltaproteobacteria bacterium CG17_big_fil_post_rev_8_21_14_2_50_63_7]
MKHNRDSQGLVLVVDDERLIQRIVRAWLEDAGYVVETFGCGEDCLAALDRVLPDAIVLDLSMPGLGGLETLRQIKVRSQHLPVVMLTADLSVNSVVSAMNLGAYDYLTKPIDPAKLTTTLRNAVQHCHLSVKLAHLERAAEGTGYGLTCHSPAMKETLVALNRVAAGDITVLIQGESGAGKELVARAIHSHSSRRDGPFVALNCAAIPETLQESELFGFEKGAFTGAEQRRIGRFEEADQGTLFLDEVGELSLGLQAKLLRAIQERAFSRVGGNKEIRSNYRLLVATHQPLQSLVAQGKFREDFYFRIAVFELEVPPLRARREDIAPLARHFASEFAEALGHAAELSNAALEVLLSYSWPGNVRELKNAVHRGLVSANGSTVQPEHLPPRLLQPTSPVAAVTESSPAATSPSLPPKEVPLTVAGAEAIAVVDKAGVGLSMEAIERQAILCALTRNEGVLAKVVKELGIGRTTLYRKMKKFQIASEESGGEV